MIPFLITILLSSLIYSLLFGLEIAFASSNKLRLELDKSKNKWTDKSLSFFHKNQSLFLSSLWFASLFSLFVYGASFLSLYFVLEWTWNKSLQLILLLVFSVLFLFLMLDVVLRLLFRFNPTTSFRFFSQPLFAIYVIVYPFLKIYTSLSGLLGSKNIKEDKVLSINKIYLQNENRKEKEEIQKGEEEIENEVRIFQNALDFSNVKLKNCIVPRTEIEAIELNATIDELKAKFVESNYSRILVYNENIDNIVGYVHSSDMFRKPTEIKSLLNPLIIAPESMAANKLLNLFLKQKKGIALVVDEFGGTAGIITLEDVMEEIFGEIEDEHDEENEYVAKQLQTGEYLLSGRLEIEDVNEQFGLQLPVSEDYITIAGLILFQNEILPAKNDVIQIDKFQFSILRVAATRIELVRLKIN